MSWEQVRALLIANILVGINLNTRNSNGRIVLLANQERFRIRIGQSNFIDISIESLEFIYNDIIRDNEGWFNKGVAQRHLERQIRSHGCFVHVIGIIFCISGVLERVDNRNYRLIN